MSEPAAGDLEKDLSAAGFLVLGQFCCAGVETIPSCADGRKTETLILIGSTGPSIWPSFTGSPEFADGLNDPLDRYTERTLTAIAAARSLTPLFPWHGPPYHPFQQWALRCEGFSPSPMGVLAHETYGPWAGFRAAFLSQAPLVLTAQSVGSGPCATCEDKPCLSACPVSALSLATGYDVPKCRTHVAGTPDATCRSGCLARRACPYGLDHQHSAETGWFHMRSFLGLANV